MNIQYAKKIMKEKKITQVKLSELTGVPLQTIKYIFTGRTKYPRIDTVEAIEKALGIKEPTQTTFIKNPLSNKEERLLDAFNSLIPPMQDYIIEMVEKLLTQPQNIIKKA